MQKELIYGTWNRYMNSFEDIVAAMAEKHGINPAWGVARPGIIMQNGSKVYPHEFEFLAGNSIARFTLHEVEDAVAQHFPEPLPEIQATPDPTPITQAIADPIAADPEPIEPQEAAPEGSQAEA